MPIHDWHYELHSISIQYNMLYSISRGLTLKFEWQMFCWSCAAVIPHGTFAHLVTYVKRVFITF